MSSGSSLGIDPAPRLSQKLAAWWPYLLIGISVGGFVYLYWPFG